MLPTPDRQTDHVLLVEGANDKFVTVHAWSRQHRSGIPLTIYDEHDRDDGELGTQGADRKASGVNLLLESITSRVKTPEVRAIGVIVDADGSMEERWSEIVEQLREAEIETPAQPALDGTIIETSGRKPRVGVWIMPNNQSSGELEDFFQTMVPDTDLVWPYAQSYVDSVLRDVPKDKRTLRDEKAMKAKVHAWLAAQAEPRPMGRAIAAGDLDTGGELCQSFLAWLQRLFDS